MQKIVNFCRGYVRIEVSSSYPERFLNLLARRGILFRNMESCDIGVFRIDMATSDFLNIREVARKTMSRVRIVSKRGLPFHLKRVEKRYLLLAGLAAFCTAAWIFTGFVWSVQIDGFPDLDEEALIENLEAEGLFVGARRSTVNVEELRNDILIKMPELSYVYVNFSGAEATVIARERKAPPEILPADVPCDIIADKDGMIESITVKTGTAEVKRGDTVIKGELLASGYVTGREGTTVITHADAEITARTWAYLGAKMQKKYKEKVFTGGEKTCCTIILFGRRIKLYPNSRISYARCDKIVERNDITLSEHLTLPISLERATYREYKIEEKIISDERAYEIMGESLSKRLAEKECEVLKTELQTSADEDFAYALLNAECVEKIGVKRKLLKDG